MSLTAEQIQHNWIDFEETIKTFIEEPRRSKLLDFYQRHWERISIMPASHKKEYHNSFPGGYVDHVLRVVDCALKLHNLWEEMGCDTSTYTKEELVFSALNHDLGKMGDEENEAYIPQTDQWRKDKLSEHYMYNTKLPFASVPDRGLFLLQLNEISYSFNEMLAIQTHDGLYDEGNKKYLIAFLPEQKPRTALPYILHQADMMAARIEFEKEWLSKLKKQPQTPQEPQVKSSPNKSTSPTKNKALKSIESEGLRNILNNIN